MHNGYVSSRQGEFHPKPLTEPYMTVSCHTALVIQIYAISTRKTDFPMVEQVWELFPYPV